MVICGQTLTYLGVDNGMTGLQQVMTHQPGFFMPKYRRFAALFPRDDQLKSPEIISAAIVLISRGCKWAGEGRSEGDPKFGGGLPHH